ncbi:MAG: hypothetical protein AAF623_17470 [Planctomycetota bacterium]
MKKFGIGLVLFSCLLLIVLAPIGISHKIQFEKNCKGFLKRAADANTIALAESELGKSLAYLASQNLTTGSTHVFYETPGTEIDFWYQNLKTAHEELRAFPTDADPLMVSNHLLKLRDTLVDTGEKGSRVTVPRYISLFPNQRIFQLALMTGLILPIFGFGLAAAEDMAAGKNCCGT